MHTWGEEEEQALPYVCRRAWGEEEEEAGGERNVYTFERETSRERERERVIYPISFIFLYF